MKLKIKKLLNTAQLPKKAFNSDTGLDLVATSGPIISDGYVQYGTGLSIQPEQGYATQIRPRSSISKYDLVLCNSVGTIDNQYLGELILRFKIVPPVNIYKFESKPGSSGGYTFEINNRDLKLYNIGDKIGQLVVERVEECIIEEAESFDITDRNTGGFGSSGV